MVQSNRNLLVGESIMTEYFVTFYIKLSAKSQKDLKRKAEEVANKMTKCLKKKVEPHGFVEVEKKDRAVQTTLW